jgi:RNase P/RNase MRP subunit p30
LSANSRIDLLRLLRRFRDMYDVIAVNCVNQAVATVACRDRRVDIVFFDPQNQRTRFGHALARVLRGSLEFNMISTFLGEGRREIFSRVSKEAAIAREHDTRVVLSSGSTSPHMVRSPLQISAIGASIGLSQQQCLHGVGETPLSIINRNKERRSREYVEEGVKVIVQRTR